MEHNGIDTKHWDHNTIDGAWEAIWDGRSTTKNGRANGVNEYFDLWGPDPLSYAKSFSFLALVKVEGLAR